MGLIHIQEPLLYSAPKTGINGFRSKGGTPIPLGGEWENCDGVGVVGVGVGVVVAIPLGEGGKFVMELEQQELEQQ